ncbi:DNA gyrase subunit A [Sinobaca sp. H24]|uniref:DNA gyrase subunit A n=1 Tax=Sinobaca sp. H24 TaxID=2923376 RepID=UPI0035B10FB9
MDGIAEVRDDTDRTGLRIVIELKKSRSRKRTNVFIQIHGSADCLSFQYGGYLQPDAAKLMGLKPLLSAYIDHQREVVTNRSRHELDKAVKKAAYCRRSD